MSFAPRPASSERRLTRSAQKFCRLLALVAVFGLAGPPVGGLVAWATMGAPAMRSPLPFVTGSYGEGVVLAFATGILVAIAAWFGRASWFVALAAAILANVAFHLATASIGFSEPGFVDAMINVVGVFLPPSIVAALASWFLVRPLLRVP